ncbi:hypothetical protein HOLleu_22387 [Holothuria leucospilota]|uniref:Ig-like domain-containing protein n=1 Tax=Holothuria leucospilota TaxID=206669 RepID=A0A9Q1BZ53_HOLLE|nr:hypothetical protein HOLleu_22387 [Holothuria leucospilota]
MRIINYLHRLMPIYVNSRCLKICKGPLLSCSPAKAKTSTTRGIIHWPYRSPKGICFLLRSKCESSFKMKQRPSILRSIMQFVVLSVCHAQNSWMINVAVGQDVRIPCGVQVQGSFERLVWNLGDGNSTEQLAYSYDGARSCNTQKKENCYLRSDGSLELQNVQETDSDDYFCAVDIEEKYYSQHTLVVHPEVAFETCPNSADVSVTQTGPDEIVLIYTNPVCKNTDVIGIVTCDPPSGAKIGISVTEIVCTCTHSGNVVDTCETYIPGKYMLGYLAFSNLVEDTNNNAKSWRNSRFFFFNQMYIESNALHLLKHSVLLLVKLT